MLYYKISNNKNFQILFPQFFQLDIKWLIQWFYLTLYKKEIQSISPK